MQKIALLFSCLLLICNAWADGGKILCQRETAKHEITLLINPPVLRVGVADFSVLIQERSTQAPLLAAAVQITCVPLNPITPPPSGSSKDTNAKNSKSIQISDSSPRSNNIADPHPRFKSSCCSLEPSAKIPSGEQSQAATHALAQNKLFYAALISFDHPGSYECRIRIQNQGLSEQISTQLEVQPKISLWRTLWFWWSLPGGIAGIWILRNLLVNTNP